MFYIVFVLLEIFVLFFLSRSLQKRLGMFFYRLTKSRKWTSYLLAVFFLPGTFFHETAHFLTALFLLVPVGQMELIPEVSEEKVKMGSVPLAKTDPIRRTLIGVSPFFFGTAAIFGIVFYTISKGLTGNLLVTAGAVYLVFEIGNTMFLSRKDLAGFWKFLVLLFFVLTAFYFLGFSLKSIDFSFLLNEKFVGFYKKSATFLLVPLIVDIGAILLLRFFEV